MKKADADPTQPPRSGMTTSSLARRFVVSEQTVRRWAMSGRIPSFRAGSVLRFDLNEVEAALRVQAAAQADGDDDAP